MTRYERTLQLERRKQIATGIALVGMTIGFITFCCTMGKTNVDVVIDERGSDVTDDRPLAREIETQARPTPVVSTYSDDDIEVLAHLIYAEAGDNADLAWAVGSVVLNRVASDLYPDNVNDVIYQKGQYSPTWHGFMDNEPTYETYYISTILLEQGSILPEDVLGQSGYEIYKRHGKELYQRIGNDYFYTLR